MKYLMCLAVVLLYSCGPTALFEQGFEFEDGSWTYEDCKTVSFVAPDTENQFDLILDIVHNESYAYENIYIQLQTIFPDSTEVTDEISIPLLSEDGFWVGKGSDRKRVRVYLQQGLSFRETGEHTIKINQYSRDKKLDNIHSVSLAIYPQS